MLASMLPSALSSLPPLLLRPHYVPKPWGGRRLETDLGRQDLPAGPIGESWEAYDLLDDDHPAGCSVVDGGPLDGQTLRSVLGASLPLFLKVLDAREDLSVQVHPDGLDGEPAKEEAWVALASTGSVSVAEGSSSETLEAVAPGQFLSHLKSVPLQAGAADGPPPTVVHVPAGTVHTIRAGALLLEVQNPVDTTWRLDDFNRPGLDGRPRQLHVQEAASVLSRPTPSPAALGPHPVDGHPRLVGEHFSISLHPAGTLSDVEAGALYFAAPGRIRAGNGAELVVPAHRTVVLPSAARSVQSSGWIIAFAS